MVVGDDQWFENLRINSDQSDFNPAQISIFGKTFFHEGIFLLSTDYPPDKIARAGGRARALSK